MTAPWVPQSGEVVAEEIMQAIEDAGIPRDEQGEIIRTLARAIGDDLAEFARLAASIGNSA